MCDWLNEKTPSTHIWTNANGGFVNVIFTVVRECIWFPSLLFHIKCNFVHINKENVWTAAIVCDASAGAHAPEVAAADSNTDSATQSNTGEKNQNRVSK